MRKACCALALVTTGYVQSKIFPLSELTGTAYPVGMDDSSPIFVAVTGAQGVGKSTFCRGLATRLRDTGHEDVRLFDGLGEQLKTAGVPLGTASTPQTIFAVWASHLEREASVSTGMAVLDRCVVDALAYTRALNLNSALELRVLEQTAVIAAKRLLLVIHLEFTPFFLDKGRPHETPELRRLVADEILDVLSQMTVPRIHLRAEDPRSVDEACDAVWKMIKRG